MADSKENKEIDIELLVKAFEPLLNEQNETEPIYIAKFILFLFLMILVNDTKFSAVALDALNAASSIVSFYPSIRDIYYAKPIQLSIPEGDNAPYTFPPEMKLSREAFFGFTLLAVFTILGFSNIQYLYAIYAALTYTFIPPVTMNLIEGLPVPCESKAPVPYYEK